MKRIVSLGLVISFITICLVIPTNIKNQSMVSATSLYESIVHPDLELEIIGRNPERFDDPDTRVYSTAQHFGRHPSLSGIRDELLMDR